MAFNSKFSSIPIITNSAQMEQMMQVWRFGLSRTLRQAPVPPPPQNFAATSARGGILLTWGRTSPPPNKSILGQGNHPTGPDGYEILVSQDGSFHTPQVISLNDVTQTQYFYPVGGGPQKFSFKLHATAGTQSSPQSSFGPDTGTIRHTSLDPNDNVTPPSSIRDNVTSDSTRATARLGRYPGQYLHTYAIK